MKKKENRFNNIEKKRDITTQVINFTNLLLL